MGRLNMPIDEFIEERLDVMLLHPEFWGSAEAFELQVLLLLEMQGYLRAPVPLQDSLRRLLDTYHAFVRSVRPGSPPCPLSAQGEAVVSIASMLMVFRRQLTAEGYPAASDNKPEVRGGLGKEVPMTLAEAAKTLPEEANGSPPEGFSGWIVAELHPRFIGSVPVGRTTEPRPWGQFVVGFCGYGSEGKRTFGTLPLTSIKRWATIGRAAALQIIRETTEPVFAPL